MNGGDFDPPCCRFLAGIVTGVIHKDSKCCKLYRGGHIVNLLFVLPSLVCTLFGTLIPFQVPADNVMVAHGTKATFRFKEGSDLFTPKDFVELSRPGSGVANVPGDLVLVPVSKYSFEKKKYVSRFIVACALPSPPLFPPSSPPPARRVCSG